MSSEPTSDAQLQSRAREIAVRQREQQQRIVTERTRRLMTADGRMRLASRDAVSGALPRDSGGTGHDQGAEPPLGNPVADGYVLSSATDGTRAWVAQGGGGATEQHGVYVSAWFTYGSTEEQLVVFASDDGRTFYQLGEGVVYGAGGHAAGIRDPSLARYRDAWYVAYDTGLEAGNPLGEDNGFILLRSYDLLTWTPVANVDLRGGGTTTVGHFWAPEIFIDDDGSFHVLIAVNNSAVDGVGGFQIFETHATNAALTSWSTPVKVTSATGTDFTGKSMIDPFAVKRDGLYYLWWKSSGPEYLEYATSASLTSGYTLTRTGNWAGWGSAIEGVSLVQTETGLWRAYFDKYSQQGIYYSESSDDWATWTAKALTTMPFVPAHGTVVYTHDLDALREIAAALTVDAARIRGTQVSTTAPTNGQALVYNGMTSQWEPTTLAASPGSAWSLLTNGDAAAPELVFARGDVIMIEEAR